jgi:pyruvate dehydrogenase E2 component (dihydrolipoamide acetyltransferase)
VATEVIMPALGIAQETGKLLQWMKNEGDAVTQGEVLMVIETDKAAMEIEAAASGVLSNVTAKVGDDVAVGKTIALIIPAGERQAQAPARASATLPVAVASASSPGTSPATPLTHAPIAASPLARRIAEENHVDLSQVKPSGERIEKADVLAYLEQIKTAPEPAPQPAVSTGTPVRLTPASPKARKAAADHGIDLNTLKGSGPQGAALFSDVLAVASTAKSTQPQAATQATAPMPVASTGEVIQPSHIWRIMAERTTQSWTSVPHFYLARDVNASRLMTWRERAQKRLGVGGDKTVKITFTDLLVRLVAAALREHPRVNAQWHSATSGGGGAIHLNPQVNIGLAVAIEDGLVVPVIQRADELSIVQIAQQRSDLVARAQSGKLKPADISGGTFTISNLGMYGVDAFNAIVNPPQAAILAVGRIASRVVPVDERPAVQPMMTLTLSCDHRAIDGARGAQFLQTLADMIEEPLGLLD